MDSRQSESVCATVSVRHFYLSSLFKEIKKNGRSAINNRMNFAVRSRSRGNIKAAEDAERDAKIMQAIAKSNGF